MDDQSFTTPGLYIWEVPTDVFSVDILLVGGGGGGGILGGGGGGGQVRLIESQPVVPGERHLVVVGAGGESGLYGESPGGDGEPSIFAGFSAAGGGGGGTNNAPSADGQDAGGGGGGGGSSSDSSNDHAGGMGFYGADGGLGMNTSPFICGGGGGAASSGESALNGGGGGTGVFVSRFPAGGVNGYFGGGGGGGSYIGSESPGAGQDGGGDGGADADGLPGVNGSGGGGGGGGDFSSGGRGGVGGCGAVHIGEALEQSDSGSVSGLVTIDAEGSSRDLVAFERRDGDVTLFAHGRSGSDGSYLLQGGYGGGELFVVALDDHGKPFQSSAGVAVDELIHPSAPNGYVYRVVASGELPESEPDWWTTGQQQVGTATLEAREYLRPLAHGPVDVTFL